MTRLILILSLGFCCFRTSAQVLPAESTVSEISPQYFFQCSPKNVPQPDSLRTQLFNIDSYLNVLTTDSLQEITDSLSGYTWVVKRYLRHEQMIYPLVVLPNTTPNRDPGKGED